MKVAAFTLGALLCSAGHAAGTLQGETPITRVVRMLESLAAKTKQEGKVEKSLCDDFICWAKSVIKQKTESNVAANARISTLETYIDDVESGRVEFTTERADLEKELAELNQNIEATTAQRTKEHQDYLDATADMTKAVTALGKASQLLKDASEGHLQGTFLAQGASQGFLARAQEAAALNQAVELGERVLSKGDALFLRRLLTGEVPEVDWKKLNQKATFKEGYKARSLGIQDVLAKLKTDFEGNLGEAKAKEDAAQAVFDKLLATLTAQKESTEEAYQKLDVENGARAAAVEEAKAEVEALKEQVANDEGFLAETKESLAEKKEECADRESLRAAELAAFGQAIEILSNDDARDLMKRSYASQGFLFFQEGMKVRDAERRLSSAAALLRSMSTSSHDVRLSLLALRVSAESASHFKVVIKAIDTLVKDLEAEENEDLLKKEQCEEDRRKDAREAVVASRTIDETTDDIASLRAEVAEIERSIAEQQTAVANAQEQLAEATKAREAERAEWEESSKDDAEAAATVERAMNVLVNFYKDNKLALLQQPVEVAAGRAPPPPPATFDAPYGGKTKEAGSIITILEVAKADIEKDAAAAKAAEDKAQAAYDKLKADTEGLVAALEGSITELAGTKGEKESTVAEKTVSRTDKKGELEAIIGRIKNAEPGCDFIAVNYESRVKNRQIEIDGLHKAKTILSGGSFDAAPNAGREVKPGDALVQRK